MKAIGLIEIRGLVPAIGTIDTMTKTSDVEFLTWEKKLGGWLVTIIIEGEVSAVQMAIEAGASNAIGKVAATAVIPNPHPEIIKQIKVSKSKL
ncbi:BMC domain-containing protein [Vallitalea okinawensis]|uniref:BMC domain-containing protein n=1 Tax=Vallitalea okinawensis TaxID=2078660 RepID=UPI000CFB61D2|nr:BMC domain-containing protein [Vallitalea okinawensis]